jgi:hypothetical protein
MGDWRDALDQLIYAALDVRPFSRSHADYGRFRVVSMQFHCEVELACFLIERGYVALYQRILDALDNSLYDILPEYKAMLEQSFLTLSMTQSNEAFMREHRQRQRGDSEADRVDEIIYRYPLRMATRGHVRSCPICVICQYNLRNRQHIRQLCTTCLFHRQCIDNWMLRSRTCPICREVRIFDT